MPAVDTEPTSSADDFGDQLTGQRYVRSNPSL